MTGGDGQDGTILTSIFSKKKKKFKLFLLKKNFKKGSIYSSANLRTIYSKKIDKYLKKNKPHVLIHLSAKNPSYREYSKKKFYNDNLSFSVKLFKKVYEVNPGVKIVFTNSSQVFSKREGLVNEKSKTRVSSYYTKFRLETVKYLIKKKINFINVILFNHDSIFRNKKFLLPRLIKAIKLKRIKFIQKIIDLNISADFSHAEDICNGIYKLAITSKKIQNIILSSNKRTSVNNIIKYILNKNSIELKLNFKSTQKKPKSLIGSNKKAKKLLNWRPKKNIYIAANEIYKKLKY